MPEISGYCATKCINRYEEYQSGRVDGPKPPPYGNAFQGISLVCFDCAQHDVNVEQYNLGTISMTSG